MKINQKVVIIHNIISPHVTPLFAELSKNFDLTVLYCSKSEDNRNWKEKPTGFRYKVLPSIQIKLKGKDLFTYIINFSIFSELNKIKPDTVVVSGWDILSYQLAFLYCKLKNIKFVVWSGSTKYERSWRRKVSTPLVKTMVRNADSCIVYGKRAKEYLRMLGVDKDKIFTSFNTTDLFNHVKRFKTERKNKLAIKESIGIKDGLTILYYGQLIERKGIRILLDAFNIIFHSNQRVNLLIVGNGNMKEKYMRYVKGKKIQNVFFREDPGDKKTAKYFAIADMFVLPSTEEVWGLVVNQALAVGIPCIVSSKCGSSADLIRDGINGYVVTPNANSIAKALDSLIKSKETRNEFSKRSLELIKPFYPSETVKGFAKCLNNLEEEFVLNQRLNDFYSSNNKYFKHMSKQHNGDYYESIFRMLNNNSINIVKGRLLDVGCGTGSFVRELKKYVDRVETFGVDISKLGKPDKILKFKLVKNNRIDYKNNYFDYVFIIDTLEHVLFPEELLKESIRVLKPNGYLFIRTPNHDSPLFIKSIFLPLKNNLFKRLTPELSLDVIGGDRDAVSGISYYSLTKLLKEFLFEEIESETWGGGILHSPFIRALNKIPVLKYLGSSITGVYRKSSGKN